MDESLDRRRRRAFSLLMEFPHNIPRETAKARMDEAGCFAHDPPPVDPQYDKFIKEFRDACKNDEDVGDTMVPLELMVLNDEGVYTRMRVLGRFREMDVDQHYTHIKQRRDGVWDDTDAMYFYLDRVPEEKRAPVQRRLNLDGPMPPRRPQPPPQR